MVAAAGGTAAVRGQGAPRKRLLFLTHAALYKHASLAPAEAAVTEYGKSGGFDVTTRQGYKEEPARLDMSFLTPEYLAQFDGLMLMTNGNLPLSDLQKRAIVDYVRNGKALIGVHCASLTLYDYPEFGEVLGGYYRRSIVPANAVGTKMGVLKVEDRSNPATRMLGDNWSVAEEFFYEAACQVAQTVDERSSWFWHTSSERAQPPQPARGCARERVSIRSCRGVQDHSVADGSARWFILLFALSSGDHCRRRTGRCDRGRRRSL